MRAPELEDVAAEPAMARVDVLPVAALEVAEPPAMTGMVPVPFWAIAIC